MRGHWVIVAAQAAIVAFVVLIAIGCVSHGADHRHNAPVDDDASPDDDDSSPDDDDNDDDFSPVDDEASPVDDDDNDGNDDDDNDDDDFAWTPMSGDFPSLSAVWGTSHFDVFAVGYDYSASAAAVMHYDGASWARMGLQMNRELDAVWGTSPSDVFAVADIWSILHYGGATWSVMPDIGARLVPLCALNGGCSLTSLWGASNSDVYTVGFSISPFATFGFILRYDGSGWSLADLSPYCVSAVWGTSASDVFAGTRRGPILHFDGLSWQSMTSGTEYYVFGIWGTSPSDVFAVGNETLHYDGSSWSIMDTGELPTVSSIWGTAHSDVFAVGCIAGGEFGTVLHYDGTSWTAMNGGPFPCLSGVWGSSSGDVFAVGIDVNTVDGAIYHYGPPD